jgi:hypothetical protein
MDILSIVGSIFTPVVNYFNRRQELKSQEHQADLQVKQALTERQIELIKAGQLADMNWEMEFARQAGSSWKDEFELLIISIPMVMCFVPGMDVYVFKGFEAISKTPAWFQFLVMSIYLANYGIRFWRKTQYDTDEASNPIK